MVLIIFMYKYTDKNNYNYKIKGSMKPIFSIKCGVLHELLPKLEQFWERDLGIFLDLYQVKVDVVDADFFCPPSESQNWPTSHKNNVEKHHIRAITLSLHHIAPSQPRWSYLDSTLDHSTTLRYP